MEMPGSKVIISYVQISISTTPQLEMLDPRSNTLLLLRELLHHHVHKLGQTLHFLLDGQSQSMGVNAAANIDRFAHSSGQDLGHAGGVLDAGWHRV